MYYKLPTGEYLLTLSKIYSYEDFCKILKIVDNSFTHTFVYPRYLEIFKLAYDESFLYNTFYTDEYATIEQYLQKARKIELPVDCKLKTHIFLLKYGDVYKDLDYRVYENNKTMIRTESYLEQLFPDPNEDEEYADIWDLYTDEILDALSEVDIHEN